MNLRMKLWILGMMSAVGVECGNPCMPSYGLSQSSEESQRIARGNGTNLNYLIANWYIQILPSYKGRAKEIRMFGPFGEFTIRSLGFQRTDRGIEIVPISYPDQVNCMSEGDFIVAALRARKGFRLSGFRGFYVTILQDEPGVFSFLGYTTYNPE